MRANQGKRHQNVQDFSPVLLSLVLAPVKNNTGELANGSRATLQFT